MKTKPIFTVVGVKGSGKTTFIRRVGQILFGDKFDVTAVSNDCKDLDTIITNNYYVAIDNLDNPPKSLNDALARIATGQIIKKRKLFTTNEELEFTVKCFVSLTSRTPQFTRDDVADRLICIYLERYETFQSENNLRTEAILKRNEIMCYIISEIQQMLKMLQTKEKGIQRAFEAVYKNPKSISTRLRNIKDNISDEVLINFQKGHGNVIFCTFTPMDNIKEEDSLI